MGMFDRKSKKDIGSPDGPGTAKAMTPEDQEAPPVVAKPAGVSFATEDDKTAAAAKIQAIKRGKQDRAKASEERNLSKMREDREKAAVKVQAIAKGRAARASGIVVPTKENSKSAMKNPCAGLLALINVEAIKEVLKCTKCRPAAKAASSTLSPKLRAKVDELFKKMDQDQDGEVNEVEAIKFFKSFAKLNARAMLNEVDTDRNGSATYEEMCDFWANVMATGNYKEGELLEELEKMIKGEGWADFDDGRTT